MKVPLAPFSLSPSNNKYITKNTTTKQQRQQRQQKCLTETRRKRIKQKKTLFGALVSPVRTGAARAPAPPGSVSCFTRKGGRRGWVEGGEWGGFGGGVHFPLHGVSLELSSLIEMQSFGESGVIHTTKFRVSALK